MEDIEGLIQAGAPSDEYVPEAQAIVDAINKLPEKNMNEASVAAIIILVWQKYFSLQPVDIQKRMPAFHAFAQKLIGLN